MIRLGIVGCGHIGRRHITAAESTGRFQVVALCDLDFENLQTAAQLPRLRCELLSSDFSRLAELRLGVVAICTPHSSHAPIAKFFLSKDIDVLVEKPLALDRRESESIIEQAAESRAVLVVAMQRRFLPHMEIIRDCFRQGQLGALLQAESSILWSRSASYYEDSPWRGTRSAEGGVLFTIAPHFIDALGYLSEFPGTCRASCVRRLRHRHDIEDTGNAIVDLPSGGLFSLSWSTCAPSEGQIGTLVLLFEKATIALGGTALERLEFVGGEDAVAQRIRRGTERAVSGFAQQGFVDLHAALYDTLGRRHIDRRRDQRLCYGVDADTVVRVIEEIYSTSQNGA